MQKQGNWKTLLLNMTKKKKIHLSKKVTPNIYIYIYIYKWDKYLLKKKKNTLCKKSTKKLKSTSRKKKRTEN